MYIVCKDPDGKLWYQCDDRGLRYGGELTLLGCSSVILAACLPACRPFLHLNTNQGTVQMHWIYNYSEDDENEKRLVGY